MPFGWRVKDDRPALGAERVSDVFRQPCASLFVKGFEASPEWPAKRRLAFLPSVVEPYFPIFVHFVVPTHAFLELLLCIDLIEEKMGKGGFLLPQADRKWIGNDPGRGQPWEAFFDTAGEFPVPNMRRVCHQSTTI